jgi:hypothetical protein
MAIDKTLQKQGYEFDIEYSDREAPAEIWINKKAGMGFRIEWFMLDGRK